MPGSWVASTAESHCWERPGSPTGRSPSTLLPASSMLSVPWFARHTLHRRCARGTCCVRHSTWGLLAHRHACKGVPPGDQQTRQSAITHESLEARGNRLAAMLEHCAGAVSPSDATHPTRRAYRLTVVGIAYRLTVVGSPKCMFALSDFYNLHNRLTCTQRLSECQTSLDIGRGPHNMFTYGHSPTLSCSPSRSVYS